MGLIFRRDSPTPIWQCFGPRRQPALGSAAVADACAGESRGVTSSENNLFSIFYIFLYSTTAFGCGARTSDRSPGRRHRIGLFGQLTALPILPDRHFNV